jgi:REP element-mobilizing transposase RayT
MHDFHRRRSIRLPKYDYSQPGAYFVTICTKERENIFGEIIGGEMRPNECGMIAIEELKRSVEIRSETELDEFVIMPNHIHFIIWFVRAHGYAPVVESDSAHSGGAHNHAPVRRPKSLASFVAGFKYGSTMRINGILKSPGNKIWHRNYFERVVRNDDELNAIRTYIKDNPSNWQADSENPTYGRMVMRPGSKMNVEPTQGA